MEELKKLVNIRRMIYFLMRLLGYMAIFFLIGLSSCVINAFVACGCWFVLALLFGVLERKILFSDEFDIAFGFCVFVIFLTGVWPFAGGTAVARMILKIWHAA